MSVIPQLGGGGGHCPSTLESGRGSCPPCPLDSPPLSLGSRDDVECDNNGARINNVVRKLYLDVKKSQLWAIESGYIEQGGKPPAKPHWCLVRTCFLFKAFKDFKKVIVSHQGIAEKLM